MTYAELVAKLQLWWESDETSFLAEMDTFIEFAEKRIYRSVDLNVTHKEDATIALTSQSPIVTIPTEVDVLRSVAYITNTRTLLLQKDISYLDDYNPDRTATGTPRYYAWYDDNTLLLAPSPEIPATNYVLYSEEFDNAAWIPYIPDTTISVDNTLAPDGTTTAELFTNSGVTPDVWYQNGLGEIFIGDVVTGSVYVKQGTQENFALFISHAPGSYARYDFIWTDSVPVIDTRTDEGSYRGSYSVEAAPNGWYRIFVTTSEVTTASLGSGTAGIDLYPGGITYVIAGTTYMWGAQITKGAGSPYIKTEGTAASSTNLALSYTYRPTQLSSGNTTTWLSLNAPDLLFYACMLEVLTFQKAEADTIADYTAKYQQALQMVLLEENKRNRTDEYRDGEIRMGAPN